MGRPPDDDVAADVPGSGKGSMFDPYTWAEWNAAREAGTLPDRWVMVRCSDGSLWKFPRPSIDFVHGRERAEPVELPGGDDDDAARAWLAPFAVEPVPMPPAPSAWRWWLVGWLVRCCTGSGIG